MEHLTAIILAVVATALSIGIAFLLTRGRGTPFLKLKLEEFPRIQDALPMLAGLTESAVYEGNKAKVFQNGAAFDAMIEDIAAATGSIHLETFVWCEGKWRHASFRRSPNAPVPEFMCAYCETQWAARAGASKRTGRSAKAACRRRNTARHGGGTSVASTAEPIARFWSSMDASLTPSAMASRISG